MATSNDSALTKRSADMALMPPPAKRIKRPAKVLDEDVYASALSHIIARDFFPGLLEAEAQEEYLSAIESKNSTWIREAGRKMTQVMTPGPEGRSRGTGTSFTSRRTTGTVDQTPITGKGMPALATPTAVHPDFQEEPVPNVDINMSLRTFQSKYTSEDNESFNELLDIQNIRRANKYTHLYQGIKIPTARQIAYHNEDLEQNEQALIVRNSQGEERRLLASGRPSQDLDTRSAQVESFPDRQGPRNNFMFEPESVEDRINTVAMEAEMRSNAPPKRTNYSGTRFVDSTGDRSSLIPPSPTMSAIDAAIAGKPRLAASSVDYSGAETPRVNGYAFVDAEPTPSELGVPVADEEAEATEREAFDRLLPKADADGHNPFIIATQSKREDIHARLVERADVARRKSGRLNDLRRLGITPGRTPTPRFATAPTKQAGQMTPAAKQLAAKLTTPRERW